MEKDSLNQPRDDAGQLLTIREVSRLFNIPTRKIRTICNYGLVPHLRRSRSGYRLFNGWQQDWLQTIYRLSLSGFTMPELKKYVGLCKKGPSTLVERKAMVTTKKHQVWQKLEDMRQQIDYLERQEELIDVVMKDATASNDCWL